MADKKISSLTGASTPLAGTEVLPVVQSGATVKVSVANLTAGRAVAMAGGSFTDNLTQSTAAKGVNFTANTPAAGVTSQLLNWYEEGTWAPVFTFATPGDLAVTYAVQSGTYTRIGRMVTVSFYVQLASYSQTTAAGALKITGLPFAFNAAFAVQGTRGTVGWYNTINKPNYVNFVWIPDGASNSFLLYATGNNVASDTVNVGDIVTGLHAYAGTITYEV